MPSPSKLVLPAYPVSIAPYIFDPSAPPPPQDYIYDGLLCKGDLVIWLGREKHRKTNVILQQAMCLGVGRDFLWFKYSASKPMRVVFIDYESKPQGLHMRYPALCRSMGLGTDELALLQQNLKIVEVRSILKSGYEFPHFPAKPDIARDGWWSRFIADNPADVYIIDPLRSFHSSDENDSTIEQLLTRVRRTFGNAAVEISHHMRKAGEGREKPITLADDMRAWSDGLRGSGAIKAHADVIVCQERTSEDGNESVWIGAFMKDGPDLTPTALEETDAMSFYWRMANTIPGHLRTTVELLKRVGTYPKYADAKAALVKCGMKRATAYLHLDELRRKGFMVQGAAGAWMLKLREASGPVNPLVSSRFDAAIRRAFLEDFDSPLTP